MAPLVFVVAIDLYVRMAAAAAAAAAVLKLSRWKPFGVVKSHPKK